MRLLINSEEADVFDTKDLSVKIFKRVFDFSTNTKTADYTLDLKLPRTLKNRKIFEHVEDLQTEKGFLNIRNYDVQILSGGVTVLRGTLIVNKITKDSYECDCVGSNLSWTIKLVDKLLTEIESFRKYYFVGIKKQWTGVSGTDYSQIIANKLNINKSEFVSLEDVWIQNYEGTYPNTFPLVNYGGFYVPDVNNNYISAYNASNTPENWKDFATVTYGGNQLWFSEQYPINQFLYLPTVYVIKLLEAIFEDAGKDVAGDFIDSIRDNFVMTYTSKNNKIEGYNWGLLARVLARTHNVVNNKYVDTVEIARSIANAPYNPQVSPGPPTLVTINTSSNFLYNMYVPRGTQQVNLLRLPDPNYQDSEVFMQCIKPLFLGTSGYNNSIHYSSNNSDLLTVANGYDGEELFNPGFDNHFQNETRFANWNNMFGDRAWKAYNVPQDGKYKFRFKFNNLKINNNRKSFTDTGLSSFRGQAATPSYTPGVTPFINDCIFQPILVKNRQTIETVYNYLNNNTIVRDNPETNYGFGDFKEEVIAWLNYDSMFPGARVLDLGRPFDYTIIEEPANFNRTGFANTGYNFEWEWEVELKQNDVVEFLYGWRVYQSNYSTVTSSPFNYWISDLIVHQMECSFAEMEIIPQFSTKFNIAETLPAIKCVNFVKEIAESYNIIFTEDENRVNLNRYDDYYNNKLNLLDWSDKCNLDESTISPLSSVKTLRLVNKKDENDRYSVEEIVTLDSTLSTSSITKTINLFDVRTYQTQNNIPTGLNIAVRQPVLLNPNGDSPIGLQCHAYSTEESYFVQNKDRLNNPNSYNFVPKFIYQKWEPISILPSSDTWIGGGTRGIALSSKILPNWDIKKQFPLPNFSNYFNNIISGVKVEVNILLNEQDVANIQYNVPIKIDKHLFYISEISGYDPFNPLTRVVLVKI